MDKLKKGFDSVASLAIPIPVTLKDWEAEKTASGFAQCYLRLAAQKQHGGHAGGESIKPTVKQTAVLRHVFKVAPKGRRLEFLRFVVDNWDVLVKALKEAGQTGKEAAEGVTKIGPRYSVEFVAAHRVYLVGQFVKDTALAAASKPVPHAQLPATSPKPAEPEELSFTQKMIAKQKAAAAKEAKS